MTYAQQSDLLAGQIGMSNRLVVVSVTHLFAGLLKMHCTRVAHDVADVSSFSLSCRAGLTQIDHRMLFRYVASKFGST